MDKETFDRAIKLAEQLDDMKRLYKGMKDWHLGFIDKNLYGIKFISSIKEVIQDIISKHEAEIRQEIDDKYNDLKKQIEEL